MKGGEEVEEKYVVLKAQNIVKNFPGVCALDNVNLDVKNGEIVGLAGANGAGKSTLIKIISGIYRADSGKIYLNGQEVNISSPKNAHQLGINTAYQEFNLVPHMSVAENIFLGQEQIKNKTGYISVIDKKKQRLLSRELLEKLGIADIVSADTKVAQLGSMQLGIIQIAKALAKNCKVLIMDEPTSVLSQREINILFNSIEKALSSQPNMGIIFITHRLEEFENICKRVIVLKEGKCVCTLSDKSISVSNVSNLMIGDSYNKFKKEKKKIIYSEKVLEVQGLTLKGVLKDINFNIRKGEIIGLTGLVGAGKTELLLTIFGAYSKDSGIIKVNEQEVKINSPIDAIKMGMGLVPEERKLQGLLLEMSVGRNISLAGLKKVSKMGLINRKSQDTIANTLIKRLKIVTTGSQQLSKNLSGGNQQKIVISKWIMIEPQILLVDELTRGIDIGAKKEVSILIKEIAQQGTAVLMSTNEIDEAIAISDKVLVMSEGEIIAELKAEETNEAEVLELCFKNNARIDKLD
ncbi:MAG: sugar ABC transporter ATP-binding protein [Candidatus Lokiarchaeota archaeon]|nr:sugar ABC transporter ATP-binding protein [Candidatus Lokiarchaeota archaeon]